MRLILAIIVAMGLSAAARADDYAAFVGDWVSGNKVANDLSHVIISHPPGAAAGVKSWYFCPPADCDHGAALNVSLLSFGDLHQGKPTVLVAGKQSLSVIYAAQSALGGNVVFQRDGSRLAYEGVWYPRGAPREGVFFSGYLSKKQSSKLRLQPPTPNGPITAPTKPPPQPAQPVPH